MASLEQLLMLKKWNLIQRLKRELWSAWKTRYLQSLTARYKWKRPTHIYKVGDIVLLKDELLFNRDWPLARVTKIFPGDDGLTQLSISFVKESSTQELQTD